jgi:hypothetical protein
MKALHRKIRPLRYAIAVTMMYGMALPLAQTACAETTAPVCHLWLSDATIAYQQTTKDMLTKSPQNQSQLSFGKRMALLNVACDKPSHMALVFHGARSNDDSFRFGNGGEAKIWLSDARLDGHPVQLAYTPNAPGQGVNMGSSFPIKPDDSVTWLPAIEQGKQLNVQITVEPLIPVGTANVSARQIFSSDISIELVTQ